MARRITRRRRKVSRAHRERLLARVLEIREQGQLLRSEHDRLLLELNQCISVGDVLVLVPANTQQPIQRVTVCDPFVQEYGQTVPVQRTVTIERFHFDIQLLEQR